MNNEDFEQWAEENGFDDDLPDTTDRYVKKLVKNELSEEEFSDISDKIERRSEHTVNSNSRYNEDIGLDTELVENDLFDIHDWTYDADPVIKKTASKIIDDIDQQWSDVNELLNGVTEIIETGADLVKYLLEKEGIDMRNEYEGRYSMEVEVNGFVLNCMGSEIADKNIIPDKQKSPMAFALVEIVNLEIKAKNDIKARLIELGRGNKKKRVLELSEYPVVTPDNEDLSFACNPWSEEVLSDQLNARINEAKKKVKINL